MRYFIFCNGCAKEVEDLGPVYFAMFGPQGLQDDDDACLVCCNWEDRLLVSSQPFTCDGCSRMVAVAPSSRWFVERHREERE